MKIVKRKTKTQEKQKGKASQLFNYNSIKFLNEIFVNLRRVAIFKTYE